MKESLKETVAQYKKYSRDGHFVMSVVSGLILFTISLFINYAASIYAFNRASSAVADIILDNIPVVNMTFLFVYGSIAFVLFVAYLIFKNPKITPFVLKSLAIFVIIRSGFVTLTHIGPSTQDVLTGHLSETARAFTSGADLFFSGHTGIPFLFALMYWNVKHLRIIFICCSIVAAAAVLLGHIHYSIDVAAAYFITYAIFHLVIRWFKTDYEIFKSKN